ncbi:MAG: hypothetical protein J6T72_01490 [Alphaproteobacteria bacterium]|nr:hypothetical protein [Alphaproteobacteria bacterium]
MTKMTYINIKNIEKFIINQNFYTMDHIDIFKVLEAINPTIEQLETYIGLRKHVFPTPLYIKTHINGYQIAFDPDEYEIKGIVIKTGIVLIEPLVLKKRKKCTYADVLELAQKVHPNARPIIETDVMKENTLGFLFHEHNPLSQTYKILQMMKIFIFENKIINYFYNTDPEQTKIRVGNFTTTSDGYPMLASDKDKDIVSVGKVHLIIPTPQLL